MRKLVTVSEREGASGRTSERFGAFKIFGVLPALYN